MDAPRFVVRKPPYATELTRRGEKRVELNRGRERCGACGSVCLDMGGPVWADGRCACPAGWADCSEAPGAPDGIGGYGAALDNDAGAGGACGQARGYGMTCPGAARVAICDGPDQACREGECVDILFRNEHGGGCGKVRPWVLPPRQRNVHPKGTPSVPAGAMGCPAPIGPAEERRLQQSATTPMEPRRLILASASPRRRALLQTLGIPFDTVASGVHEALVAALAPQPQAIALALRKARAVAAGRQTGLILGADTIVALDDEILGKPRDERDAARMLRALSGRTHEVVTGIALIAAASGQEMSAAVSTTVQFRRLADEEIARYVASGEPHDKAGGYAIQGLGAALIAACDGCVANVVGLPLCETARLFAAAGLATPVSSPVCRLPDGSPCPRIV